MITDELTMQFDEQLIDLTHLYHALNRYPLTIDPNSYLVDAMSMMYPKRAENLPLTNLHSACKSRNGYLQPTSCVLVVEGQQVLGILTEQDLVKLAASNIDFAQVTMSEVMTQPVMTMKLSDLQDVATVLSVLHKHQIRHLPIVDDEEHLVGIVTATSLLQELHQLPLMSTVAALQKPQTDLHQQVPALDHPTSHSEKSPESFTQLQITQELCQQEITQLEAWRQTAQIYRQLIECQTDLILRVDQSGRIKFANPAACQIFGKQLHEFASLSIFDLFPAEELPQAIENLTNLKSPPHNLIIKEQAALTVKGIRWFEWHITGIKNESGEVVEFQGVGRDITDRKLMEEALRTSEDKFRCFADNSHALFWMADFKSGYNLYVNPAYEKIWGRSCESLREQPISWLESVHPEDRDRVIAKIERQKHGEATNEEYRILRPDGSVRWIWDQGFAMRDEQGKVYAYGGVAEDITERKQIEESLRQSQERLSLALISAHMGIFDWNLLTNDTLWSANMGPLYGLCQGTICPDPEGFLQLLHPDDRKSFAEAVKRSIAEHQEFAITYRVIWHDGSVHWLSSRGQTYYNEIGQPIRMIGTTRDISERKQAEAALKESEELYRSVVTAMQEGVVIHDRNGKVVACNASAERILGYTGDFIMGRVCSDTAWGSIYEDGSPFPGDEHPAMVSLRTGKPCSNVIMGIHKPNGQLTWISINSQPLWREQESLPSGVVVSFSDISELQAALLERQQAEQKIREQADLLNIATDAIFVRDLDNHILYWNRGAESLYGWSDTEVVGKKAQDLLYPNTSSHLYHTAMKTVIAAGVWQGELPKVTKSGQEIFVESRWTLVRDKDGKPKSILIVDTDITQKKQLEEQFLRTQRLESLGTLAGGIAHDLNNILTPILAAAQILKNRTTQKPVRSPKADITSSQHLLEIIENNAKRGASLVKQVLSFARGCRGERTIVQLKHLITDIILIGKQTFPKSIEFATELPEDLSAVSGNATQLHQVLMNLVVNARDAMPEGGTITVSAENIFIDQAYASMNINAKIGHYIVVKIRDTGIGMPPKILDRIFEPFFTTKEVGTGTGLGLSTVLGITKSHGGFVTVSSKVGEGSQFNLFLPAVSAIPDLTTDETASPQGDGELILVVDDEAKICEIIELILAQHNYKTLTANNGIEAIALYAQHKHQISAIFMDMMMPEMDGVTAIRTLQKMNPNVQIIACSGQNPPENVIGVHQVLPKPFTANELLNSLHDALRDRGTGERGQGS